jgi:hypothetical protein
MARGDVPVVACTAHDCGVARSRVGRGSVVRGGRLGSSGAFGESVVVGRARTVGTNRCFPRYGVGSLDKHHRRREQFDVVILQSYFIEHVCSHI